MVVPLCINESTLWDLSPCMVPVCSQVYTYYGGERNRSVSFLSQQDIVLTTYNVLSTELEAKNGIMKVCAKHAVPSGHVSLHAVCGCYFCTHHGEGHRNAGIKGPRVQDMLALIRF